jgi:hypothetical protein
MYEFYEFYESYAPHAPRAQGSASLSQVPSFIPAGLAQTPRIAPALSPVVS